MKQPQRDNSPSLHSNKVINRLNKQYYNEKKRQANNKNSFTTAEESKNIKSVYNFIPAPEEAKIVKPDWANQVSHDMPFSDWENGEIELTITAKTPIFIRNGHSKEAAELFKKQQEGKLPNPSTEEEREIENYLSFSKTNRNGKAKYFIPGTSLKGMIRNTLEIMTFSRLKVENDIFSYRDMASHRSAFKTEVASNRNIKPGWLEKVNNSWIIKECQVGRVAVCDIEQRFDVDFNDKSAAQKYASINSNILKLKYYKVKDLGSTKNNRFIRTGTLYNLSDQGNVKGDLVFFGSIDSKKYEYFFTEPTERRYSVNNDLITRFVEVDKKVNKDKKENEKEQTQWQYLTSDKNPYPNNRIPVFFKENNKNVVHFGFSRLYKMSNTKSLNELNPLASYFNRVEEYKFDLAETIFGTVEDTDKEHGEFRNKKSLKGRVAVGHAFDKGNNTPVSKPMSLVLGEPKASYYPFYLKEGKTYLDKDAELRGFKKYPVHGDDNIKPSNLTKEKTKIQTRITPLPTSTMFEGKIRFFNLRKVEIGALLSAITLHKHEEILSHSLGCAKPLGFGKVSISVKMKNKNNSDIEEYIAIYEKYMTLEMEKVGINWINSDALKELFAISKDPLKEMLLKYPELEREGVAPKYQNEFNNYKKDNLSLKRYSLTNNGSFASIIENHQKNS